MDGNRWFWLYQFSLLTIPEPIRHPISCLCFRTWYALRCFHCFKSVLLESRLRQVLKIRTKSWQTSILRFWLTMPCTGRHFIGFPWVASKFCSQLILILPLWIRGFGLESVKQWTKSTNLWRKVSSKLRFFDESMLQIENGGKYPTYWTTSASERDVIPTYSFSVTRSKKLAWKYKLQISIDPDIKIGKQSFSFQHKFDTFRGNPAWSNQGQSNHIGGRSSLTTPISTTRMPRNFGNRARSLFTNFLRWINRIEIWSPERTFCSCNCLDIVGALRRKICSFSVNVWHETFGMSAQN